MVEEDSTLGGVWVGKGREGEEWERLKSDGVHLAFGREYGREEKGVWQGREGAARVVT